VDKPLLSVTHGQCDASVLIEIVSVFIYSLIECLVEVENC